MILNKNKGFSLPEMMIALGAMGALSYVGMYVAKNQTKATTKISFETELILTLNEMQSLLSSNDNCIKTFSTTNTPSGISNYNNTSLAESPMFIKQNGTYLNVNAPVAGYGEVGLQIDSYNLTPKAIAGSGVGAEEILDVNFVNKKILKDTAGVQNIVTKKIALLIQRDVNGKVKTCRTMTTSSEEPWQHVPNSNDIYYEGGAVGINIVTPTHPTNPPMPTTLIDLDVAGTIYAHVAMGSDRRLKTNIMPLKNSLKKTLAIRGVSFNWKKNGKHDVGVIAQEIEKEMPGLVLHNSSNNTLSVDYISIIPFLIEAIKDQQKEINDLNKQLNHLE
jgi:prepilin-type N-terminal cleavage/methylation domain-containing protein